MPQLNLASPRSKACDPADPLIPTGPLEEAGSIQCQVRLGTRDLPPEQVTYSVSDLRLVTQEETVQVTSNRVTLTCPPHPVEETEWDPLTHVWYYPLSPTPRVAAATGNPRVVFTLPARAPPLVVACATYHLLGGESSAHVTTYTVTSSSSGHLYGSSAVREDEYPEYGQDVPAPATDEVQGAAFPPVLTIVLGTAGAVLAIILAITAVKYLKRSPQSRQ